jgi:hypothetical protein
VSRLSILGFLEEPLVRLELENNAQGGFSYQQSKSLQESNLCHNHPLGSPYYLRALLLDNGAPLLYVRRS